MKTNTLRIINIGLICLLAIASYLSFHGPDIRIDLKPQDMRREIGQSFVTALGPKFRGLLFYDSDSLNSPRISGARLFEDNIELGPKHSIHDAIRKNGNGQFSHWGNFLYFSTSDNSDPTQNGRRYTIVTPAKLNRLVVSGIGMLVIAWAVYQASWRRNARTFLFPVAGLILGYGGFIYLTGILFWFAASILAGSLVLVIVRTADALMIVPRRFATASITIALSVFVVFFSVSLFEAFLWVVNYVEGRSPPIVAEASVVFPSGALKARNERHREKHRFTMPKEWERRTVNIPGAKIAYYWHGVLHIHNEDMMRRAGPFPSKAQGTFRVIVVGDSLTYGYGIDEKWTFTRLLENLVRRDFPVEFLNLGVSGYQSSNIVRLVKEFTPRLRPDLIIYAVTLNDFLDSGVGEHREFVINTPLFLLEKSEAARFFQESQRQILVNAGLMHDFQSDILKNYRGYKERFEGDMRELSRFVQESGLPPVVSMVVHQAPKRRSHRIALDAEDIMRRAGMAVIDTSGFFKRYDGHWFRVSKWEGHPDEEANAIFASMINNYLNSIGKGSIRRDGILP